MGEIDNSNMAKSKAASVKLNQTSFDPLIKIFSDHEESFKLNRKLDNVQLRNSDSQGMRRKSPILLANNLVGHIAI